MAGEMWGLEKTIIGQAIKQGSITDLKDALANGEDVTIQDRKGNTYLHYICTMYRPYIFNILAVSKIDINARNKHGNTALHVTALNRECGHAADLLMYGIDPFIKNKDGKTASEVKGRGEYWQTVYDKYQPGIFKAVDDHDVNRVKELLHCWCRTDARRDGQTIRQYAAARKHHDIVLILDQHRYTLEAICGVLEVNHAKVSKAINSGKCDINFLNKASELKHILLHALRMKDSGLVQLVCNGGADVNLPIYLQNYLTAPMYFAVFHPRLTLDITWTVLKSKPNFLLRDQRGRNAVIYAMDKSNREVPQDIIQYMMQNGIYLADRDATGTTARDVARLARRQDVVNLLDKMYIKLLREEEMEKLDKLAQDGYDSLLITSNHRDTYIYACGNETDTVVRFVQQVPDFQARCRRIREAVMKESVDAIAKHLEEYPKPYMLANCKDKGGRGLLHLSVLYWRTDVMSFLLSLPYIECNIQDNHLRTPFHYACAMQEEERELFKSQLIEADCDTRILDCQWLTGEDYQKHPEKAFNLEMEKNLIYGMDKRLLCVDKYKELRQLIRNKRRTLKDFKLALRSFKQCVSTFAKLLSPVVDDYRDLIFLAVDSGKLEIAEYLAHLGADLTRKEQYLALGKEKVSQAWSSQTSTTIVKEWLPSEIMDLQEREEENNEEEERSIFMREEDVVVTENKEAQHTDVYSVAGGGGTTITLRSPFSFGMHQIEADKESTGTPTGRQHRQQLHPQASDTIAAPEGNTRKDTETSTTEEAPFLKVEMLSVVERARQLGYQDLAGIFERKLQYERRQREKKQEEKCQTPSKIGSLSSFSDRSFSKTDSSNSNKDKFSSDDEYSYSSDEELVASASDSSAYNPVDDFISL